MRNLLDHIVMIVILVLGVQPVLERAYNEVVAALAALRQHVEERAARMTVLVEDEIQVRLHSLSLPL